MPKKKKSSTAIVPASQTVLLPKPPSANLQAILERMVRQRVDEILAASAAPQPAPDRSEAKTVFDRRKHTLFFDRFGCWHCGKKNVSHGNNGNCSSCASLWGSRMGQIKRDYELSNPEVEIDRQINRLTSRFRSAKALLGEDAD